MGSGDVRANITPMWVGVDADAVGPGRVETLDKALDHSGSQRLLAVEVIEHSALGNFCLFGNAIEGQAEYPFIRDDFFGRVKQAGPSLVNSLAFGHAIAIPSSQYKNKCADSGKGRVPRWHTNHRRGRSTINPPISATRTSRGICGVMPRPASSMIGS